MEEKLKTLLSDVHQLLIGWHSDGTAWTEWDESVKKRVFEMMEECEKSSPSIPLKKYNNIRNIMVNIKEGEQHNPTCIQSIPTDGIVYEYADRYEWDVITENGLLTIKQSKRDFVWTELLYK